jgi:hypothetical protein
LPPLNIALDSTIAMAEYTKRERAELRRLTGEVYEWELGRELKDLDESFRKWRKGEILSSELSDAIHEFHQHAAREIWSMYQRIDPASAVARGLAMGALTEDALWPSLRDRIKVLSRHYSDADESAV